MGLRAFACRMFGGFGGLKAFACRMFGGFGGFGATKEPSSTPLPAGFDEKAKFHTLACAVGMPLLPWQATKKPSSTPPVVPGAAPALAKAGVGGFLNFHCC